MTDSQSTYDIAAPYLEPYVQTLWPGALAMPIETRDQDGRRLSLADDHLSGRSLLLVFLNGASEESSTTLLQDVAGRRDALDSVDCTVIVVNACSDASANQRLREASGFPWPIAGDSTGAVFASYGLHKENGEQIRLVLLTPLRQVRLWFDTPTDNDETLNTIMDVLENSEANAELRWAPPHAPVLLVPNVLSAEECGKLVESFETGAPFMIRPPRPGELAGDYKIPVYEHDRQDRVDQIIRDPAMLKLLDERLFGRVTPMMKKAFAFEVTRREDLHIARYVGTRGGHAMGHRDNTSPATAYRRFALSMSLNEDYEGGGVVFKEFSPKPYRPPAGTAMVFSSSLLHEVQETTSGTRYNLISHLFNEESLPR